MSKMKMMICPYKENHAVISKNMEKYLDYKALQTQLASKKGNIAVANEKVIEKEEEIQKLEEVRIGYNKKLPALQAKQDKAVAPVAQKYP